MDTPEVDANEKKPLTYGEELTGKIVKVNHEKGYGFIISPEKKFTRFFFHWTSLDHMSLNIRELEKGMEVKFREAYQEGKGWRAVQIKLIEN